MTEMRLRVGVDLVPIPRVVRLLASAPDVLETLLTERERTYCAGRRRFHEHVAARFAAKEAVLKALGTGVTAGVRWTEIEVTKELSGRPGIRLHGAAAELAQRAGVHSIELSISHSDGLALAHAVALFDPDERSQEQPAA